LKDFFSIQSNAYAKYRPDYPDQLFDILLSQVPEKKKAWDCGTGNGQVASKLANYFKYVVATDISENQIKNAKTKHNLEYRIEQAEKTSFSDSSFDLITVAQAVHWFDLDRFYKEVRRTLKPNGMIAIIGYWLIRFNPEIDSIIDQLHDEVLGNYWDKARYKIEDHYESLPFPFEEVQRVELQNTRLWTLDQLIGYFSTWSALQTYIALNDHNPLPATLEKLENIWGDNIEIEGNIPVFMKSGKI
jgi:ubiquinone/menaquinone biosynthesis C-methylase UbiE